MERRDSSHRNAQSHREKNETVERSHPQRQTMARYDSTRTGPSIMTTANTLAALRLVRRESDLLDCLQALAANFPQNEKIGDALLDLILVLDDHLNN